MCTCGVSQSIILIQDYNNLESLQNGNHVPGMICLLVISLTIMDRLPLSLTPKIGHVSYQFCVVFDDIFITVPYIRDGMVPPNCKTLVYKFPPLATPQKIDSEAYFNQSGSDNRYGTTVEFIN